MFFSVMTSPTTEALKSWEHITALVTSIFHGLHKIISSTIFQRPLLNYGSSNQPSTELLIISFITVGGGTEYELLFVSLCTKMVVSDYGTRKEVCENVSEKLFFSTVLKCFYVSAFFSFVSSWSNIDSYAILLIGHLRARSDFNCLKAFTFCPGRISARKIWKIISVSSTSRNVALRDKLVSWYVLNFQRKYQSRRTSSLEKYPRLIKVSEVLDRKISWKKKER